MAQGKPARRSVLSRYLATLSSGRHLLLQHHRRIDAAGRRIQHGRLCVAVAEVVVVAAEVVAAVAVAVVAAVSVSVAAAAVAGLVDVAEDMAAAGAVVTVTAAFMSALQAATGAMPTAGASALTIDTDYSGAARVAHLHHFLIRVQ